MLEILTKYFKIESIATSDHGKAGQQDKGFHFLPFYFSIRSNTKHVSIFCSIEILIKMHGTTHTYAYH